MKTIEYLDEAKKHLGITSDYALAAKLDVTRSFMSMMRHEKAHMSDDMARTVAAIIGIHAGLVILDMHRQKASTPEEQNIWKDIFQGFQVLLLPAKITPVYLGFNRRKQ